MDLPCTLVNKHTLVCDSLHGILHLVHMIPGKDLYISAKYKPNDLSIQYLWHIPVDNLVALQHSLANMNKMGMIQKLDIQNSDHKVTVGKDLSDLVRW